MRELIDKAVVAAEIKRRIKGLKECHADTVPGYAGEISGLERLLSFLDTLEVKKVDTWHSQEKENIYDAVKDWSLHTFACVMKDGTIQKFTGMLDEDCEGHISVNIDGVNDDYDNVDDIVKWIEFT
jgi:hypothetical protein